MSRPTTGIRRIENVEGGVIAWLYGETDLDAVLLELVRVCEEEGDLGGVEISYHPALGPYPCMPDNDPSNLDEYDPTVWEAYHSHVPPFVGRIDEDIATAFPDGSSVNVGWFRRFPWCTCGEGHAWHYEESAPGRGASLAVLVSWYC